MHSVSANYTMPTILNTLSPVMNNALAKPLNAQANAAQATSASSSTSSSTSGGGLGATFLSLLAQELQNQDPTAPVDPTAMVGQMISLSELEQLININQRLSAPAAGAGAIGQPGGTTASGTALSTANGGVTSMLSPSAAGAATSQLPFDPSTMMPLGFGNAGALAASFNSSINAATMGLSGTSNNATGGK